MLNLFAVFFGGGIGAVTRYLTGLLVMRNFHFNLPVATFLVNIIGSFIIGFLYIIFVDKQEINPALKFALTVGFCGGLTTFSTFSLEIFEMLKNAQFLNAFCYVLLSVIICVISVWIGVSCAKLFI